jgi:MFS family permease
MEEPKKLFNKNFTLLWMGQTVSGIGSGFYTIAILLWLKGIGSSASTIGFLMVATSLPGVILGPFGGTLADRFSRKKIIVISDMVNGVAILVFALALLWRPEEEQLILVLLFAASTVRGIMTAFFLPAIIAAVPDLVPKEKVLAANSIRMLTAQTIGIAGQSLGGIAYLGFGAVKIFIFNSISYIFSGISELFMKIPKVFSGEKERGLGKIAKKFFGEMAEGFHYAKSQRGLFNVFLIMGAVNFFLNPFVVLMPFFVPDFLAAGDAWLGYLLGSLAVGMMLGVILANILRFNPKGQMRFLMLLTPVLGLLYLSLGFATSPVMALFLIMGKGMMAGIFNLSLETILQTRVPSEMRGRVFGLLRTITSGLIPISFGLAGIVADWLDRDIPLVFQFCGLMIFLSGLLISFNGGYREILGTKIERKQRVRRKRRRRGHEEEETGEA